MKPIIVIVLLCSLLAATTASAEKITVAAAADLKFAMDEIVAGFTKNYAGHDIEVVYGSSGKFHTQIQRGAPYDMYFSADIDYTRELAKKGLAASEVVPYAFGRLVLWSNGIDTSKMTLESLAGEKISKIAIANPRHAPYGKRAEEALRSAGLWEKLQTKLVYGENVAQAAQFVQTGNAQVGIIALSLALSPGLSGKDRYYLIPDTMHRPLEQGFIITSHGSGKPLAKLFAGYISSKQTRAILAKYGFILPVEKAVKR